MTAAVFARSLVVVVCGESREDTRDLEDSLHSMGFTVTRYARCDQAITFPPPKMDEVHLVIAGCAFEHGVAGGEAVETLYRHFLGVPLALLADPGDDTADRLGSAYGFPVVKRPVQQDQLARVLVMAHVNRVP